MQLFRRFLELTTAIVTMLVYPAQVIVPSGMRITFLLSKRIPFLKIHLLQNHFGHLMSSLLVKIFSMIKLHPPTNRSPASHDPQTAHQSGSTQTSGGPRVLKAVSGFLVPPTLQGDQSFFRWVKTSLWVSFCWDLIPKKRNKSSSGSPPKKGHFFDFVWWVVSLRAVCIGNALWWKHGVGLNLLGMKPFRFRGYLLLQVTTSRILTIWLDHIIFYLTHPIFWVKKLEPGNPFQTMELGNMITHVVQQRPLPPKKGWGGIFLSLSPLSTPKHEKQNKLFDFGVF